MTALQFDRIYTSACANSQENNIACSGDYLLYSRTNAIMKLDLRRGFQQAHMLFHQARVNGLKLIATPCYESPDHHYIISTTYDKIASIWQISTSNHHDDKMIHQFESSNGDFTSRCAFRTKAGVFFSITTTINNTILITENQNTIIVEKTNYTCLDAKIHFIDLEQNTLNALLFLAGTDNKVHIFFFQCATGKETSGLSSWRHIMDLSGHSDWIKCMETLVVPNRENQFLLASSSLDSLVRIWHMKVIDTGVNPSHIRTLASSPFRADRRFRLTATLETVLSGHEAAVTSLFWFKNPPEGCIQLITCSLDKSIIIWQGKLSNCNEISENSEETGRKELYDPDCVSVGVWKELFRFGETGETNLPFLCVCLSEKINRYEPTFYSLSLRGAIHSWRYEPNSARWMPGRSITGHFEPVTDLSWESNGVYLLSVSLDKTCRLHAEAKCDNLYEPYWTEISRPQVHGYEINCLASTGFNEFATGSDEMTIRFYGATEFFIKNFISLTKPNEKSKESLKIDSLLNRNLPKHAQLSALGLTLKGGQCPYDVEQNSKEKNSINNLIEGSPLIQQVAKMDHLDKVPSEEILLQSTLWWETNKLFGHGNELFALAYSGNAPYLASSSKANRPDLAGIILWHTDKFRKLNSIYHHSLTITRLKFSHSDRFLLSVSRDRTWCLCIRNNNPREPYVKLTGTTKSNAVHERIIWDCAWTWDDRSFVTVSRDKRAIIWSTENILEAVKRESDIKHETMMSFENSVQAVDSLHWDCGGPDYLFAFGFEDGSVSLMSVLLSGPNSKWVSLNTFNYHHLAIRRLAFCPVTVCGERAALASAGEDCILNVITIKLARSFCDASVVRTEGIVSTC